MINHHFGGKQALFDAIIEQFSTESLAAPLRVIGEPATSGQEFEFKFKMFVSETFQVMVAQSLVFQIVTKENGAVLPLTEFRRSLISFAKSAQSDGFLRAQVDVEMIVGFVLDRLGNQIIYAASYGADIEHNVLTNKEYRQQWLNANVDLMLHGLV